MFLLRWKKRGRGWWRKLCRTSKQLDCILSWYGKWPGMYWVLKNGTFHTDDSPSDFFCKTPISKKAKWICKIYFIGTVESRTRSMKVCPTKDMWGIYLEYKCYWYLTWFVIFNEWKSGYKCLSPVPFYLFSRGLPLLGCLHMCYVYT